MSSKDSVTYSNTILTKPSQSFPSCSSSSPHGLNLLPNTCDNVVKDQIDLSETYSSTSDRKSADVERGVQKLELTEKRRVHLRAGSEINLTSAGKHNKRTSFRQSLAVCTERAQVGPVSSTHAGSLCSCVHAAKMYCSMVFMIFPWNISAGPGRFPEPSAASDSLSQNLPETSALIPVHRTREGLPEEEGQSHIHIISVSCYCQNEPSVRPLVFFDRSNDHVSKCSS